MFHCDHSPWVPIVPSSRLRFAAVTMVRWGPAYVQCHMRTYSPESHYSILLKQCVSVRHGPAAPNIGVPKLTYTKTRKGKQHKENTAERLMGAKVLCVLDCKLKVSYLKVLRHDKSFAYRILFTLLHSEEDETFQKEASSFRVLLWFCFSQLKSSWVSSAQQRTILSSNLKRRNQASYPIPHQTLHLYTQQLPTATRSKTNCTHIPLKWRAEFLGIIWADILQRAVQWLLVLSHNILNISIKNQCTWHNF